MLHFYRMVPRSDHARADGPKLSSRFWRRRRQKNPHAMAFVGWGRAQEKGRGKLKRHPKQSAMRTHSDKKIEQYWQGLSQSLPLLTHSKLEEENCEMKGLLRSQTNRRVKRESSRADGSKEEEERDNLHLKAATKKEEKVLSWCPLARRDRKMSHKVCWVFLLLRWYSFLSLSL